MSEQIVEDATRTGIWDCVATVVALPWFSRVWVLQEIGLAQDAIFWWGCSVLGWRSFVNAVRILFAHGQAAFRTHTNQPYQKIMAMGGLYAPGASTTMLEVLQGARGYDASDPRDKVYSLMAHPCIQSPLLQSKAMLADYSKTKPEVYLDSALVILSKTQQLRLLSAVVTPMLHELPDSVDYIPTWVPRWDITSSRWSFGIPPWCPLYRASGVLRYIPTSSLDLRVLLVRGILLDTSVFLTLSTPLFPVSNGDFLHAEMPPTTQGGLSKAMGVIWAPQGRRSIVSVPECCRGFQSCIGRQLSGVFAVSSMVNQGKRDHAVFCEFSCVLENIGYRE
jgi:hypothetical protein